MEDLKNDIKKAGKEVKEKAEEKINVASEFVSKVKDREYILSGDAIAAAGLAVSGAIAALIGTAFSLNKKNEKLEAEIRKRDFYNGVLVGKVGELRRAEILRKNSEKQDSQE